MQHARAAQIFPGSRGKLRAIGDVKHLSGVKDLQPPREYYRSVRRVSAAALLAVFSLSLIGPALSTSDPASNLPPCCRRDGKHHCAMMASRSAPSSGPVLQSTRCPLFPTAKCIPVNRTVGLPSISHAGCAARVSRPTVRPRGQAQALLCDSFSRARQKRAPPAFTS